MQVHSLKQSHPFLGLVRVRYNTLAGNIFTSVLVSILPIPSSEAHYPPPTTVAATHIPAPAPATAPPKFTYSHHDGHAPVTSGVQSAMRKVQSYGKGHTLPTSMPIGGTITPASTSPPQVSPSAWYWRSDSGQGVSGATSKDTSTTAPPSRPRQCIDIPLRHHHSSGSSSSSSDDEPEHSTGSSPEMVKERMTASTGYHGTTIKCRPNTSFYPSAYHQLKSALL